jgi:hypothetical protein
MKRVPLSKPGPRSLALFKKEVAALMTAKGYTAREAADSVKHHGVIVRAAWEAGVAPCGTSDQIHRRLVVKGRAMHGASRGKKTKKSSKKSSSGDNKKPFLAPFMSYKTAKARRNERTRYGEYLVRRTAPGEGPIGSGVRPRQVWLITKHGVMVGGGSNYFERKSDALHWLAHHKKKSSTKAQLRHAGLMDTKRQHRPGKHSKKHQRAVRATQKMSARCSSRKGGHCELPKGHKGRHHVPMAHRLHAKRGPKQCPRSMKIESLVFAKKSFCPKTAAAWAKKNKFTTTKGVDLKKTTMRLRQKAPSSFTKGSFRTIPLTRGVQAVVGCPKARKRASKKKASKKSRK